MGRSPLVLPSKFLVLLIQDFFFWGGGVSFSNEGSKRNSAIYRSVRV